MAKNKIVWYHNKDRKLMDEFNKLLTNNVALPSTVSIYAKFEQNGLGASGSKMSFQNGQTGRKRSQVKQNRIKITSG